jgi:hypothetical protein
MHKHIIVNHDIGLYLVICTESQDVDLVKILDDIILQQLACHA